MPPSNFFGSLGKFPEDAWHISAFVSQLGGRHKGSRGRDPHKKWGPPRGNGSPNKRRQLRGVRGVLTASTRLTQD